MNLIIAANWKMHKTAAETAAFCRELQKEESNFEGVDVIICPPFTALPTAGEILQGSKIKVGAQNIHWEEKGAFTGEIAASMLLEYGVEYVIIGHSERRHIFGENDMQINRKVKAAFNKGLKPILCVGETEDERHNGATELVLQRQLVSAFEGLNPEAINNLVIAYEPVWAIGTGRAATAEDAGNAGDYIHDLVREKLGVEVASRLRIQYGGSVKPDNIGSFVTLPSVAGALVGGASLATGTFINLITAARKAVLH